MVAKKAFGSNDHNVWSMLWRWAVRRHQSKGTRWIKQRYFKTKGSRNWVFAATEVKEDGTKREHVLLKESDTPIHRHIKINYKANPHDPTWARYFESRWGKKMLRSPKGLAKLYRIWLRQDRRCSGCQQPITKNTRGKSAGT
jgi:RNA-directed DNA polymerase